MKDCNSCSSRQKCSPKVIGQAERCRDYKAPTTFKVPLLVHLVYSGKINQVADVLSEFDMQLDDIKSYPYFRLNYNFEGQK